MLRLIILLLLALGHVSASAQPFGAPVPRVQPPKPLPAPAASPTPAPAAEEWDGTFALVPEVPLDEQLEGWARRSGWTFRWYSSSTWRVIAPSSYGKDFERAFHEVMDIVMHEEGKPLRFTLSRGNRVVEVYANDLR